MSLDGLSNFTVAGSSNILDKSTCFRLGVSTLRSKKRFLPNTH